MTTSSSKPELIAGAAWADRAFASSVLPRREAGAHKWGVGGVVIIAGSPSYTGAAYLASRAAGRAGAGIVHLASGRGVIGMLAGAMPEVAHIPLPETDAPGSARRAVERLEPYLEKARAVVIGPGLGDDDLTDHLLASLLGFGGKAGAHAASIGFGPAVERSRTPDPDASPLFSHEHLKVVFDADALTWLSRHDGWWEHLPAGRVVLTPHPGEMARLTGLEADDITASPQETAAKYAAEWATTVVLKTGHSVASNGTMSRVAPDAPVSLATAGSGDVLAGTIGALLAQGLEPVDAAGLALYAGAAAARLVEERFGALGTIASDLPDAIALAMRDLA